MADFTPLENLSDEKCVSLIGIAGSGKSTLGKLLATRLGWAHLDTDKLIEATWGQPLQTIMDERGLKGFLDVEEAVVSTISVKRSVISTGGSVIYRDAAVARLKKMGPVIHLHIELGCFLDRVQGAKDRAFARAPGRSLEEVYAERLPLYAKARDILVRTDRSGLEDCLEQCLFGLEKTLGRV